MSEKITVCDFEELFLPYLGAAYNLARWIMDSEEDAEDVVQDAYLRAFRFIDGFRGQNNKAWFLRIVRNVCYSSLKKKKDFKLSDEFDEEFHSIETTNPETILFKKADFQFLKESIEKLPPIFREVLILREIEGFSYQEIADISEVPLGTVMSRLARARRKLQEFISDKGATR